MDKIVGRVLASSAHFRAVNIYKGDTCYGTVRFRRDVQSKRWVVDATTVGQVVNAMVPGEKLSNEEFTGICRDIVTAAAEAKQ